MGEQGPAMRLSAERHLNIPASQQRSREARAFDQELLRKSGLLPDVPPAPATVLSDCNWGGEPLGSWPPQPEE